MSVAALSVPGASFAAAKKPRPNFLFLFADDPRYAHTIKQLRAKLKELQKEVGDTLDLDNPPTPKKRNNQGQTKRNS